MGSCCGVDTDFGGGGGVFAVGMGINVCVGGGGGLLLCVWEGYLLESRLCIVIMFVCADA